MDCSNEKKSSKIGGIESSREYRSYHESGWMFWRTRRFVVSIMAFFGFFTAWALRINLSVALLAMTETKNVTFENGSTVSMKEFDWDSKTQGYILSSFFYGLFTTQILGGYAATKFGGKLILGLGIGITSFLTLITPWVAKTNVYLFIAVRIIEGIFEGATYPCVHAMWSKWAPPLERSRLALVAFSGGYVGIVVALSASSLLSSAFGWEIIFYSFGVFGLSWSLIWMWTVADSPDVDSRITPRELNYITESLSGTDTNRKLEVPWSSFATSTPVWAIAVASFSENWGAFTLVTELPKFMKSVLKLDLNDVGFMSCLPYLGTFIMLPIAGNLVDLCIVRGTLSITQVRKAFNCSAFIGQAIFLLLPVFLLSSSWTIVCLMIAQSLVAFASAGCGVNHLDIGPQYASILMGIANTFGTIPGIVSPIITGYIVTDEASLPQWRIIFYISSAVYLFGAIIYGTFASCELQPWASTAESCNKPDEQRQGYPVGKLEFIYENENFHLETVSSLDNFHFQIFI